MTSQVISFYETMENILAIDTKTQQVHFTYKAACQELNEL